MPSTDVSPARSQQSELSGVEALLRAGALHEARARLVALRQRQQDPYTAVEVARLLAAARMHREAEELLSPILSIPLDGPTRLLALNLQFALQLRLGRASLALAALDEWLAAEGGTPAQWHRLIHELFTLQQPEAAGRLWRSAIDRFPRDVRLWLQGGDLQRSLGDNDGAIRAFRLALSVGEPSPALRLDIAQHLIAACALVLAREQVELVLSQDKPDVRAWVLQARLQLWSGEVAKALESVSTGLAQSPQHPDLLREHAAAVLLSGQSREALTELDTVLQRRPGDQEAHLWRAEALAQRGELAEAERVVTHAVKLSGEPSFPAQLQLELVRLRRRSTPDALLSGFTRPSAWWKRWRRRRFGVPVLLTVLEPHQLVPFHEGSDLFEPHDREEWITILEGIHRQLRGNRSIHTFVSDERGEMRPVSVPESTRTRCIRAVQEVERHGEEGSLARLEALRREHPTSPLPLTYAGELALWFGHYPLARKRFLGALRLFPATRWAYIGLAAVALLEGHPRQALRLGDLGVRICGSPGPTHWIYRGEAFRRLGRWREAEASLRTACELTPSRVSAWVNLALLQLATNRPEARDTLLRLEHLAPGLLVDAAREVEDETASHEVTRILEHALTMMRGNRSSSVLTYFTRDGAIHFPPFIHLPAGPFDGTKADAAFLA